MSARLFSALDRVRQVRRVQRLSLFCVASACAALSLNHVRLTSQKSKAHSVVQHALDYCAAFEKHCEPEGEPRFCHENVPLPAAKETARPLWYVPLNANGQHYALILRADTGKLCYVFNVSPWEENARNSAVNSLTSDADHAAAQSLLYLQRLQAVSETAQIALNGQVESVRRNSGWRVVWNVRNAEQETSESVRITVSQTNGRLLQFANLPALNQKTH